MLLTIGTTRAPATDLGFLLAKHPERTQSFELAFGRAHVFYPEATEQRCTAALLVEVDPVALVRRTRGDAGFALSQYTNDRPYAASSFMSVAIGRVFGAALGGRCREHPELAERTWPLQARICVLPARGGERFVRALFEPLGYTVELEQHGPYFAASLTAEIRLADLLRHLTVLIPVLDDDKHYWVGHDEVDKLLARGEGWLAAHPQRDEIAARYLVHRRSLTREALRQLSEDDEPEPDATDEARAAEEAELERVLTLEEERRRAVLAVLRRHGVRRVIDVGCGEGRLLADLAADRSFERVVGMDVSMRALERAHARLRLDEASDLSRARLELFQGSLGYRDARLAGFDAACAVEVVEHIDPSRLDTFEAVLFEHASPRCVVVTTPNVEYNVRFESLPAGRLRHRDHRFEWSRAEFEGWARAVADRHGYELEIVPVGRLDPEVGSPTQMGVFTR